MMWSRLVALLVAMVPGLAGSAASAQDAARGEQLFRPCRACHEAGPNARMKAGPPLTKIVGKKAAEHPEYNYSDGLKAKAAEGLVWTEDALSAYLASPSGFVPKGRMPFAGMPEEQDRKDLIAYLKAL